MSAEGVARQLSDVRGLDGWVTPADGRVERLPWLEAVAVRFWSYFWPVGCLVALGVVGLVLRAWARGRLSFTVPLIIGGALCVAAAVVVARRRDRPRSGVLLCRLVYPRKVPEGWGIPRAVCGGRTSPAATVCMVVARAGRGLALETPSGDVELRPRGIAVVLHCSRGGRIGRGALECNGLSTPIRVAGKLTFTRSLG